jgi:hypothetical protein
MTGRYQKSAAILAFILLAGSARAQDDWATTRESFLCKSNTEVREIKTYISNSSDSDLAIARGCRVDYIKNGMTKTIWSSRTSRSYCDGKASHLAARLEASHFSCSPLRLQRTEEG